MVGRCLRLVGWCSLRLGRGSSPRRSRRLRRRALHGVQRRLPPRRRVRCHRGVPSLHPFRPRGGIGCGLRSRLGIRCGRALGRVLVRDSRLVPEEFVHELRLDLPFPRVPRPRLRVVILGLHGRPARRARLLSLHPRPQAPQVEDVAARQLLRNGAADAVHGHVVPADDARVVQRRQFLRRRVREPLV